MGMIISHELENLEQYLIDLKSYKPSVHKKNLENTPMFKIDTLFKTLSNYITHNHFITSETFFIALQMYLLAEQYKQKLAFLGHEDSSRFKDELDGCDIVKNFASNVLQNNAHICFKDLARPESDDFPYLIPNSLLQSLFLVNDIDAVIDMWKNFFKTRIKNQRFIELVEEEISTLQGYRSNLAYNVGV